MNPNPLPSSGHFFLSPSLSSQPNTSLPVRDPPPLHPRPAPRARDQSPPHPPLLHRRPPLHPRQHKHLHLPRAHARLPALLGRRLYDFPPCTLDGDLPGWQHEFLRASQRHFRTLVVCTENVSRTKDEPSGICDCVCEPVSQGESRAGFM